MAVQKSRKSPSKTRMKRAHDALTSPALTTDRTSGEVHRRHHITKLGYLKGKKALRTLLKDQKNEQSS